MTSLFSTLRLLARNLFLVASITTLTGTVHADTTETTVNYDIVIIGASYAEGWDFDPLTDDSVLNVGIGGEETDQMLARFDTDVVAHNPQVVVIWGLINDIFRSPAGQMEATEEKIKSNYLEMIDRALANGIKPIIAAEVTMGPKAGVKEWFMRKVGSAMGKVSYQERINENVARMNDWLKEISDERGLLFLDLAGTLSGKDGMRLAEYCQPDGSHISDQGYAVISNVARGPIRAQLAR